MHRVCRFLFVEFYFPVCFFKFLYTSTHHDFQLAICGAGIGLCDVFELFQ